jgi:hypothetical protein
MLPGPTEATTVRSRKIDSRRFCFSLVLALVVTLCGVEAFMRSIHDSSTWLRVVEVAGLPLAALANTVKFFRSNFVYWASIFAGGFLWWYLLYVVLTGISKNSGPQRTD